MLLTYCTVSRPIRSATTRSTCPEFAVHGHTAKFMLCISDLRIGDRVPTSTPACPHGTTFPSLFHAVTRHNVCPQTANSGQGSRSSKGHVAIRPPELDQW